MTDILLYVNVYVSKLLISGQKLMLMCLKLLDKRQTA